MDIESMRENQVLGYAVLYGFETGPAWTIIKKNGGLFVRWPGLDEQRLVPGSIDGLKKSDRYLPENGTIILKDGEYAFLIKKEKVLLGKHEELLDKLGEVLMNGDLDAYEEECVLHYIRNVS